MAITTTPSTVSSPVCRPRWATRRRPDRATLGGLIGKVAEQLGQPLMPWQQLVADVGGEVDGSGKPFYREVIVTVPRQSGKTTLTLSWELQRALGWGGPQKIAYTAQTGWDAHRKLLDDQVPMIERTGLWQTVSKVGRSTANSSLQFVNGSRIDVLATTEHAGHGRTIDLAILDEVFADSDFRREQAVLPAMATRRNAQMLVTSTMGTEGSVLLNRKVDAGRAAVVEDRGSGIAYFEWSAPLDSDIGDPAVWRACSPALGFTIDEDTIGHAFRTMPEGDFRRGWLNQSTVANERVIPESMWAAVCSGEVAPDGRLRLGVDVAADRSATAVVIADDKLRAELVEYRPGTSWVVERVAEIATRWSADVVVDGYSPAGSFIDELEAAGVNVLKLSTREVAAACGRFYDRMADRQIEVRSDDVLDRAATAARRRQTGDAWLWSRKDAADDLSPLVALTLALDQGHRVNVDADLWGFWE